MYQGKTNVSVTTNVSRYKQRMKSQMATIHTRRTRIAGHLPHTQRRNEGENRKDSMMYM